MLYLCEGVSQKLEYTVILTLLSLKIWEKDSRTRQDSCISLLPEKEDIRIGMNGNISRWYDSLPRIPKRINWQTIKTRKAV